MKIKTEAAAYLTFRIEELNRLVDEARWSREFGVAQRVEQIVATLEDAREYILHKDDKPKQDAIDYGALGFIDFLSAAPTGSRIVLTDLYGEAVDNAYYTRTSDGLWQDVQGNEFTIHQFSEGEDKNFKREVARG